MLSPKAEFSTCYMNAMQLQYDMLPTPSIPSFSLFCLSFATITWTSLIIQLLMLNATGQICRSLERSSKSTYIYTCTVDVRTCYVLIHPPSAPGAPKTSATHSYRYVMCDHCDYYSHSLSPSDCKADRG